MKKLEGKVAIVTGAGQGIGRGIAHALAKEGVRVVIAELNRDTGKVVEKEIRGLGAQALAVVCDVANAESVKKMVDQAVKAFGPIDILVNNAQKWGQFAPAEDLDEASWDLNFDTGPKATWFCCKAVFPHMKDRGGKIINFGSRAGITGQPEEAAYAGAKEAIRGFSRTVAREWGKYNINVNVICPASRTPALDNWEKQFPEATKVIFAGKAIARWADPEQDIGRTAVFLASKDSDLITGQTIIVDGGYHMI